MNEKRAVDRRRELKSALIVLSEKAPKIECVVRNKSDKGAALQVSTTVGLPRAFDVVIEGTASTLSIAVEDGHPDRGFVSMTGDRSAL